jgi:hypothetical protein
MAPHNPYQPPNAQLDSQQFGGGMPGHWDIGTALSTGWELFKNNVAVVLITTLIVGGVSGVFQGISQGIGAAAPQLADGDNAEIIIAVVSIVNLLISLVAFVVNTWLSLGYLKVFIKIVRSGTGAGAQAEVSDVFTGASSLLPAIGANILTGLIVLVGFLLLIVPGYIAMLGLLFTLYLIVDKNLGPIEAMKESWRITDGHKANLFLFLLVAGLVILVGMLACFVGLIVAAPVVSLATAYIYCQLTGTGAADAGQPSFNQPQGGQFGGPPQGGGFGGPPQGGGFGGGTPPQGGGFGKPPQGGGFGGPPQGGGFGGPPQGGGFGGPPQGGGFGGPPQGGGFGGPPQGY